MTDSDYVYYNVSMTPERENGLINTTRARYFEVRDTGILNDYPENYNMSIVRFSIPTGYIPLKIVPIDVQQTDINKTLYSVTLEWNGNIYQEFIIWKTQFPTAPRPESSNISNYRNEQYVLYYSVYNIDYLFNLVNEAYIRAFNKLVLDGAPISTPPFISLDKNTNLVTIYIPEDYIPKDVFVYHNNYFNRNFLNSFSAEYQRDPLFLGREVKILTKNIGTNINTLQYSPYPQTTYILMTQQFATTQSMSSFSSIVIISRSLPFQAEWISRQTRRYENDPEASNIGVSSGDFLNILADYEIDQSKGWELGNVLIYLPTSEYRRMKLYGTTPITNIEIEVFWKDNFDNLYPVIIPEHKILTIKLLFEKIK